MAGAGYKLFNTGDVLTAQQVNEYLMQQTTMVFASAAARTSALSGVLAEGMVSYLQDTNTLEVYDGSSWVGATGDITGLTAGTGITISSATGPVPTITNSVATTFDALGDLVVGTGADTFAKLTVGNSGDTIVADSSATTGLRWQANQAAGRNTCINGGMDIWQRGTSFTPTSNASTLGPDRWVMYRDGGSGATVSQQASGLTNFLYACRVARNSGNTSTNSIYIWQHYESQSTYQLAGKTIVISYYARAGANYSPTSSNLGIQLFTGTGVDQNIWTGYTGQAQPLDTTQAITTTWTRYTQVLTLNSNVTEMCLRFYMTPTGTAGANDWFEITGIQVELGNVPTTFTRAGGTIAGELAACQRYYYRPTTGLYTQYGVGFAASTTQVDIFVQHPVTMRVAPSFSQSATKVFDGNGFITPSGVTTTDATTYSTNIRNTVTGATQFRPYKQSNDNNANAYIELSAEL